MSSSKGHPLPGLRLTVLRETVGTVLEPDNAYIRTFLMSSLDASKGHPLPGLRLIVLRETVGTVSEPDHKTNGVGGNHRKTTVL